MMRSGDKIRQSWGQMGRWETWTLLYGTGRGAQNMYITQEVELSNKVNKRSLKLT